MHLDFQLPNELLSDLLLEKELLLDDLEGADETGFLLTNDRL